MQTLRERLLFYRSLRVVLISCRIVHASDLKAELDRHFPEGSGVAFDILRKNLENFRSVLYAAAQHTWNQSIYLV